MRAVVADEYGEPAELDSRFPVLWPLIPGWDAAGGVVGVGPAVRHVDVGVRGKVVLRVP